VRRFAAVLDAARPDRRAHARPFARVESLIAQGKLDPAERDTHPDRNKLFNCLGAPSIPMIDMGRPATLQPGDVILMCSDGLWSVLPEQALAVGAWRQPHRGAGRAGHGACGAALAGQRNSDNVTALAMMWEELDRRRHGASTGGGRNAGLITTSLVPLGAVTAPPSMRRAMPTSKAPTSSTTDEIEKAIAEIRAAIDKSSRILT
jgi:hypothetical protein